MSKSQQNPLQPLPFTIHPLRLADYARLLFKYMQIETNFPLLPEFSIDDSQSSTRHTQVQAKRYHWKGPETSVSVTIVEEIDASGDPRTYAVHCKMQAEVQQSDSTVLSLHSNSQAGLTHYTVRSTDRRVAKAWDKVCSDGPLQSPLIISHPTLPLEWMDIAQHFILDNHEPNYRISPKSSASHASWPVYINSHQEGSFGWLLSQRTQDRAAAIALPLGPLPKLDDSVKRYMAYIDLEDDEKMPEAELWLRQICNTKEEITELSTGVQHTAEPIPPCFLGGLSYGSEEHYQAHSCQGWTLRHSRYMTKDWPTHQNEAIAIQGLQKPFALFGVRNAKTAWSSNKLILHVIGNKQICLQIQNTIHHVYGVDCLFYP